MIVDGINFVAGTEVEDFAVRSVPSATGTENIASFEPGNENNFVRRRNGKRFSVHLRVLNFEVTIDPPCNRMRRITNPEPFFLARFTPGNGTTGPHQTHKRFGIMGGMQGDESHTLPDSRKYALHD